MARLTAVDSSLNSDVLVPKFRTVGNEFSHHLDTFVVLNDIQLHALLAQPIFRAKKSHVLANDNSRNLVEQRRSAAHRTR